MSPKKTVTGKAADINQNPNTLHVLIERDVCPTTVGEEGIDRLARLGGVVQSRCSSIAVELLKQPMKVE